MALRVCVPTYGDPSRRRIDPAADVFKEKVQAAANAAREPGRPSRRRWFAAGWAAGAVEGYYHGSTAQGITPSHPEGDDPGRDQH